MRDYEIIFILQPDLDESSLNDAMTKVKGWITEAGGIITKEDIWGKRQLAYPIRKQKEGQYIQINAQLSPSSSNEIERNLRLLESVMRFSIILVEN